VCRPYNIPNPLIESYKKKYFKFYPTAVYRLGHLSKNLKFNHLNAGPHVLKGVKKVLLNPVITYSPYSPDLALCNFDLIFLSSDHF